MDKVPHIWRIMAGLPRVKQPRKNYPRAKRTKAQLEALATEHGLTTNWDCYCRGSHGVTHPGYGDSIQHYSDFGYGHLDNASEVEECIEEFIKNHPGECFIEPVNDSLGNCHVCGKPYLMATMYRIDGHDVCPYCTNK